MKLLLIQENNSIQVDNVNWQLYLIIGLSILLCISLFIAISSKIKIKKLNSEIKKLNEINRKIEDEKITYFQGKRKLEDKLNDLNKEITQSEVINPKKVVEKNEIIADEIAPSISLTIEPLLTNLPKEKEVFYVNKVNKEGRFDMSSLTKACADNSLYRIVLIDDNNATFEFINQTKSIKFSLDIPHDILFPVCEQIEAFNQEAKAIITQTEGKLIKENNYWKVTEKAKIKYD